MAVSQVCMSNDVTTRSEAADAVDFYTFFEDEDDDLVAPQFDEFDMWEQQQSSVGHRGSRIDQISEFQKLFLDELNVDGDVNRAAAKALQRFASLPAVTSTADRPAASAVQVLSMNDESDECVVDHDVDEFDLWNCRQRSELACRTEGEKEAINSFQKMFLEELSGEHDRAGAAANALMRLLPSRQLATTGESSKTEDSPTSAETSKQASKSTDKQRAAKVLQAFYSEELAKCGDANLAAVAAFGRLNDQARRQRARSTGITEMNRNKALGALKQMLATEVDNTDDINGSVAKALLRLRARRNDAH